MNNVGEDVHDVLGRAERASRSDPLGAVPLAAAVADLAGPDLSPDLVARVALLRARAHHVDGEHLTALAQIRVAQREWVADGRLDRAVQAHLDAHAPLLALGEFEVVIGSVQKLFADLAAAEHRPGQEHHLTAWHAHAHLDLGRAHHGRGDHQQAMRHFDVAANLFQVLADPVGGAHTRAARGRALLSLDMAHRAADELLDAYTTFFEARHELPAYQTLTVLARAFLAQGRASAAIGLLQRVRGQLLLLGARADLAELQLVLGSALLRAGLPDDASEPVRQAAATFARLTMTQRSGIAELLRAEVAHAAQDLPGADAALATAERLLADCGAQHLLARVWLTRMWVAEQGGDRAQARQYAQRVLDQQADGSPAEIAGYAHSFLAAHSGGAESEAHLNAATETAYAVGSQALHLTTSLVRARAHVEAGNAGRAIEVLRRTAHLVTFLEHEGGAANSAILGRSPVHGTRDLLIDLLVDRGTHQSTIEAWATASAAKASSVRRQAGPAAEWRPTGDDGGAADALSPWPVSPEELAAQLAAGADTVNLPDPSSEAPVVPEGPVLEYHVLTEDVIAFVVREGQVHLRRLKGAARPSRAAVEAWQTHCTLRGLGPAATRFLTSDSAAGAADGDCPTALAELRTLLVEPLSDLLEGDDEPWAVVPHRHLHAVPFEAFLALPAGARGPLDAAFSFSSRPEDVPSPADPPPGPVRPPLVLAVPDEVAPLIQAEAEAVAAALPGAELHSGSAATRRRLLDDVVGRPLVHVVCHGVSRSRNPFYSALRLGDGWVTARDLLHADLGGSLAVLSACSSGSAAQGDHGPIGLAWSALAAGATGVVAAMWPVEDGVAARLMEHFYRRLVVGAPARTALALARQDLAADHPDPHSWAAFRYFSATG